MKQDLFSLRRKSHMEAGRVYFWTATIHQWHKLLWRDERKDIIINALAYLSEAGKVDVFAFVIMPTHIHLIWRINQSNGKEKAHVSFLKYTAHHFRKLVAKEGKLDDYKVEARNKQHEFWQRDSLAVRLNSRKVALQKLNYIHANPLAGHWQLVKDPCDYRYSSAKYYERNVKNFSFLKDLWEVI